MVSAPAKTLRMHDVFVVCLQFEICCRLVTIHMLNEGYINCRQVGTVVI